MLSESRVWSTGLVGSRTSLPSPLKCSLSCCWSAGAGDSISKLPSGYFWGSLRHTWPQPSYWRYERDEVPDIAAADVECDRCEFQVGSVECIG